MKSPMYVIAGVVLGGLLGYLYYRFVGCKTGACPIVSKPVPSILYGAALGGMIGGT
ncbi:MAG TPA: hypothetical protein PLY93_04165 [Turneriella sp.]|nr:hypothetical protein [Turneriella sp.]